VHLEVTTPVELAMHSTASAGVREELIKCVGFWNSYVTAVLIPDYQSKSDIAELIMNQLHI
jgi:hypothetical protein